MYDVGVNWLSIFMKISNQTCDALSLRKSCYLQLNMVHEVNTTLSKFTMQQPFWFVFIYFSVMINSFNVSQGLFPNSGDHPMNMLGIIQVPHPYGSL